MTVQKGAGSPQPAPPEHDVTHARVGARHVLREMSTPVRVLLVGIMVNRAGSLVQLFLVLYASTLGFGPARAGILLTTYGAGAIGGVLVGGWLSDRVGARSAIVISMTGSAASVALLTVLTSYPQLLVLCFCCGALNQVYRPAAIVLLSHLTPANQLVVSTAAYRVALNLGMVAAPLFGATLALVSYRWVFAANALTAIAFAIVALVALPGRDVSRPHRDQGAGPPGRTVTRNPRYGLVLAGMLLITLVESQAQTTVPLNITARGYPVTLYAVVITINAVLVIALELPVTPQVQRLPINVAISVGAVLTGLGFAMFDIPAGVWILVAAAVVWTAGEIANAPSVNAYPAMIAPPHRRGRYISALNTSQAVGTAVGPAIWSAIYQFDGAGVWMVNLVLAAFSGAFMYFGVVSRPQAPVG